MSTTATMSLQTLAVAFFLVVILQFVTFGLMFDASRTVMFHTSSSSLSSSIIMQGQQQQKGHHHHAALSQSSSSPLVPCYRVKPSAQRRAQIADNAWKQHFVGDAAMMTGRRTSMRGDRNGENKNRDDGGGGGGDRVLGKTGTDADGVFVDLKNNKPAVADDDAANNNNNNNKKNKLSNNNRLEADSSSSSSEASSSSSSKLPAKRLLNLKDAAVVVLTYNRPEYLKRTLRSILRAYGVDDLGGLFISIDGNDARTLATAKRFSSSPPPASSASAIPAHLSSFEVLQHHHVSPPPGMSSTFSLAAHYQFVFNQLFVVRKRVFSHLIVLEDDMDVGADIFHFFDTFTPVLNSDPTVWCISSWNDNAFDPPFSLDLTKAFRSSYFPGLGWMLKRSLWVDDLSKKWPSDNWDHWMRVSSTHQQRSCIVPFVSRNFNFGSEGSTANQDFYTKYLGRAVTTGSPSEISDASPESRSAVQKKILDHVLLLPPRHRGGGGSSNNKNNKDSATGGGGLQVKEEMQSDANYDTWIQESIAKGRIVNDINTIDLGRRNSHQHDDGNGGGGGGAGVPLSFFGRDGGNTGLLLGGGGRSSTSGGGSIVVPYVSEQFEHISQLLSIHNFPRTHYKFVTWFTLSRGRNLFLVDRRLSPFATEAFKISPDDSLEPVAAKGPGISCHQACREHSVNAVMKCDESQFDFINNCETLREAFPGCACQQGWGEDIPNMEAASIHHPPPANCLVTEMKPTCAASHPLTTRLCPCVRDSQHV